MSSASIDRSEHRQEPVEASTSYRTALPAKKMAQYTFDPRTKLPVGNSSLIGKDLSITDGSVVEIEYLYWTGKAVIQPRIIRKREDKPAGQCDLSQFPAYTRELAWRRG